MTEELDDVTHGRVESLSSEGNALVEAGDLAGALKMYGRALKLLPEPTHRWEAATWLFTALGDVLFLERKYRQAKDALNEAMRCPNAIGNPFIHLRLGQANYELKEIDCAKDELARAYIGGGDELFEGEDPKYKLFIKEILRPEQGVATTRVFPNR
jgi:tetratricopeptide (TPR) repeat protein